nr:hypothetical protein CFP56_07918 [Quercus suber]
MPTPTTIYSVSNNYSDVFVSIDAPSLSGTAGMKHLGLTKEGRQIDGTGSLALTSASATRNPPWSINLVYHCMEVQVLCSHTILYLIWRTQWQLSAAALVEDGYRQTPTAYTQHFPEVVFASTSYLLMTTLLVSTPRLLLASTRSPSNRSADQELECDLLLEHCDRTSFLRFSIQLSSLLHNPNSWPGLKSCIAMLSVYSGSGFLISSTTRRISSRATMSVLRSGDDGSPNCTHSFPRAGTHWRQRQETGIESDP